MGLLLALGWPWGTLGLGRSAPSVLWTAALEVVMSDCVKLWTYVYQVLSGFSDLGFSCSLARVPTSPSRSSTAVLKELYVISSSLMNFTMKENSSGVYSAPRGNPTQSPTFL